MISTNSRFRLAPMVPRDPEEDGRTASPLELFFDLVFVVAVSIAGAQLHHFLSEGDVVQGVINYGIVFFGIWWAWMNFTWFATSFDTDDWLYRILTIIQMGGVLVLASGIEPAFTEGDYSTVIIAYVMMRLAMVAKWLRAARLSGPERCAARIYAVGISIVQIFWISTLLINFNNQLLVFILLIMAELLVPVVAERCGGTPWHVHHITERYGLFTLIVLGESLLGSANAIIEARHEGRETESLLVLACMTLVVTASLWWIYFWPHHHRAITTFGRSVVYGYGHYFIFAAAGALSAGIEAEIDVRLGHSELHHPTSLFALAIPMAIFIICIWYVALKRHGDKVVNSAVPLGSLLVLISPLMPAPLAFIGVTSVLLVVVMVWRQPSDEALA